MSKHLLILDLDETLLHARENVPDDHADFLYATYAVRLRPHLKDFLEACRKSFELAVWTSAGGEYANEMVRRVFGSPADLAFVWSVDRCTRRIDIDTGEVTWIKDLGKVRRRGFDLDRVLVVDDSPEKHARNYGNLVPVEPFTGDANDRELPPLARYLERLAQTGGYRRIEKRGWRGLVTECGGEIDRPSA